MIPKSVLLLVLLAGWVNAAEKYDGPAPPKPDVPYLLHARTLVETEVGQAREESKKNDTTYSISGAGSTAKTPLAEPIFIVDARKLEPERMELYKLEVRGGNREVTISGKRKGSGRPLHLAVTRLEGHLYKVEVDEPLENGQYAISPAGENRVFCFEVY